MFRTSKLVLVLVLIGTTLRGSQYGQMNFAFWQTPVSGVVASGGTATSGNSYNQWSFTTTGSSTFTVTTGGTVYYTIVAGGGGGGCWIGGGGAGGGVIVGQTTVTAGTYTIVVGSGGAGGPLSTYAAGSQGGNSSAFGFTAVGGGGGGSGNLGTTPATFGGSGGGAYGEASASLAGAVGVAGQGWQGGSNLTTSAPYPSGGGGGAGGVGGNGSGTTSGSGGTGLGVYLPVSASTVYYGGGGGGASSQLGGGGTAGTGGTGGGGNGSATGAGGAASANTGGGGGGGAYNSGGFAGGAGGSGIVVIWSPIATPSKTPYVQYLAVAGGGGGSSRFGGGGGAGGVLQGLAQVSAGTSYTITVGTGGAGDTHGSTYPQPGGSGVNSSIAGSGLTTITAVGGGGGGGDIYRSYNPTSGGSGGGGGVYTPIAGSSAGAAGTTGQGNNGGSGITDASSYFNGGGGGGYNLSGYNATSSGAGLGGDGFTTYIANPATYSWSNHFNGTTDWATTATASGLGSGNYTIEFWFYELSVPAGTEVLYDQRGSSNGVYPMIYLNYLNTINYYVNSSLVISGGTVTPNAWNHVAIVRNGSSNIMYLNGTQTGSTWSSSSTFLSNPVTLAASGLSSDSHGSGFNGYISNVRTVIGTAVYTSSFTPPTTPLTAITNTNLLTCQAGSFVDSSTNAYTVTPSGSTYVASQNPFGASYAYGGSGGSYFGNTVGANGGANTGYGGTGAGGNTNNGGNGGSGVVILAYPSTYPAASSTTGSPTVTTTGGFRVYTFTGGGTITF